MSLGRACSFANLAIALFLFAPSTGAPVFAQISNSPLVPQLDPNRIARDLFHNELQSEIHDQSLWCFRELTEEHGQKKLLAVCQSTDGEIDRLLEVNGQELNPAQREAEDQRLQRLLTDPDEIRRRHKREQDDAKQAQDLLRKFPDAFQYQYAGMQGNLIELKFSPNPDFHPSGRPAQVFHHLEGSLLLDPKEERLAQISGQLTSDVKFGWGLLGHLDEGGTFFVKQQDLGSGHWEIAKLDVQMNGKALFFKTISVQQHQIYSDFRAEPDGTTREQALEFLHQDPAFR